jgi:hypothetical protein
MTTQVGLLSRVDARFRPNVEGLRLACPLAYAPAVTKAQMTSAADGVPLPPSGQVWSPPA